MAKVYSDQSFGRWFHHYLGCNLTPEQCLQKAIQKFKGVPVERLEDLMSRTIAARKRMAPNIMTTYDRDGTEKKIEEIRNG